MHTQDTINAIAAEHARTIEDRLAPQERAACAAGDAVLGDYMDEWQSLLDAFALVVGRPCWLLDDHDAGACSGDDVNADHDALYAALEEAESLVNLH